MKNKVDFTRVKGIPIGDALQHYGVIFERGSNGESKCDCPLPSHTSKDKSTFAFGLNKEGVEKWFCHSLSCQKTVGRGGDVIDLVRRMMGNSTLLDAAKKLAELFPAGSVNKEILIAASEVKSNKPLSFQLKDIQHEFKMIQDRGISVETARSYGVGFFPGKGSMAGRVVFPLHEHGELIGYYGRAVADDLLPRWLAPKGLVKSFCYGLERCDPTKLLIVTESLWSPLWFREKEWQCACLLGKEMTEAQEAQLEPYKEIILALDGDEAGRAAREKIATRLRVKHRVIKSSLLE